MMTRIAKALVPLVLFTSAAFVFTALLLPSVWAKVRTCPPFHLRAEDGRVINPLTGENADQPYSTRQTCGACHDYDKITKGYHFQQGWDRIKDDFSKAKPWVISDGMMGKH